MKKQHKSNKSFSPQKNILIGRNSDFQSPSFLNTQVNISQETGKIIPMNLHQPKINEVFNNTNIDNKIRDDFQEFDSRKDYQYQANEENKFVTQQIRLKQNESADTFGNHANSFNDLLQRNVKASPLLISPKALGSGESISISSESTNLFSQLKDYASTLINTTVLDLKKNTRFNQKLQIRIRTANAGKN